MSTPRLDVPTICHSISFSAFDAMERSPKMRSLSIGGTTLATVLALVVAGGCANRMHDENLELHQQNRELQAQLDARNSADRTGGEPETASQAQPQAQPPVTQTPQPSAPPTATTQAPAPAPAPIKVEGTETTEDPAAGTMTVRVPGDVLFDPGKATVREGAKSTLDQVAAALKKDYAGKQIRVEGHTDADPIRVSQWKSNQELSEARAAAVKTYLAQKGVNAGSISTTGFGADKPKGQDKAQNRRVEIVVITR
jgi:outer membrane protein OmpA-like peptidoglycan-associated protein